MCNRPIRGENVPRNGRGRGVCSTRNTSPLCSPGNPAQADEGTAQWGETEAAGEIGGEASSGAAIRQAPIGLVDTLLFGSRRDYKLTETISSAYEASHSVLPVHEDHPEGSPKLRG